MSGYVLAFGIAILVVVVVVGASGVLGPRLEHGVAGAGAVSHAASGPARISAPATGAPWFGVLQPDTDHLNELASSGVGVTVFSLAWDRYEPHPGVVDPSYVAGMRLQLERLQKAGLQVILDAGLQYPPSWVFDVDPDARFVNQYGQEWVSDVPGSDVPNAIFDPAVRAAQAQYIAEIAHDFGDPFMAVRVGGLVNNELHYPDAVFGNHVDSFWAFDANARRLSPLHGAPIDGLSPAGAKTFATWYVDQLAGYQNWQIATYRTYFHGWIQVLYPGRGLRPGDLDSAALSGLGAPSLMDPGVTGLLAAGQDWQRLVDALPTGENVVAYITDLEAPDRGTGTGGEAPARYLAQLAAARGIPVAGENSGGNDRSAMARCIALVRELGLQGMLWMNEEQLLTGSPSLADYTAMSRGG